jgi:hypothetical protein
MLRRVLGRKQLEDREYFGKKMLKICAFHLTEMNWLCSGCWEAGIYRDLQFLSKTSMSWFCSMYEENGKYRNKQFLTKNLK